MSQCFSMKVKAFYMWSSHFPWTVPRSQTTLGIVYYSDLMFSFVSNWHRLVVLVIFWHFSSAWHKKPESVRIIKQHLKPPYPYPFNVRMQHLTIFVTSQADNPTSMPTLHSDWPLVWRWLRRRGLNPLVCSLSSFFKGVLESLFMCKTEWHTMI